MNYPISTVEAVGLAVLTGLLLVASQASGYQQTQTCTERGIYACGENEEPKPVHWPKHCLEYRINEDGTSNFVFDLPDSVADSDKALKERKFDRLRELVRKSFRTWTEPNCTSLQLIEGALTEIDKAEYNKSKGTEGNDNVVTWRDDEWPYASDSAFALTSVTFPRDTGVIHDADTEFNTEFYTFIDLDESGGNNVDFRNTLTHEVGHFIGLAHPEVPKATMYGSAPIGEIDKRSLYQDDIDAVCHIYPADDSDSNYKPSGCKDNSNSNICQADACSSDTDDPGTDASDTGSGNTDTSSEGDTATDPNGDTGGTVGDTGGGGTNDGCGCSTSGSTGMTPVALLVFALFGVRVFGRRQTGGLTGD